jgi:hypothetical protein
VALFHKVFLPALDIIPACRLLLEATAHEVEDGSFAAIIAYNLLPKKPEMNIEIIDKKQDYCMILIPNSRSIEQIMPKIVTIWS